MGFRSPSMARKALKSESIRLFLESFPALATKAFGQPLQCPVNINFLWTEIGGNRSRDPRDFYNSFRHPRRPPLGL